MAKDVLFYGDNLDILRERIAPGSVDLVYLDPPFNSNASYNVLFADKHGTKDSAQIHAFEDTWTWTQESERVYFDTITGGTVPAAVADAVQAMHNMIGENDLLAYLVMMAPRLVALHRVLKPTGSLYLHCDPTASHYLKLLLDSVFGPERFMNEIIWKRTSAHSSAKRYAPVHDVILFYAKSDRHAWNQSWQPLPQETIDQWYNNFDPDGRRFNRADLTAAGIRKGPSGEPWRGIDPTKKGRHWAIPGFVEDIVEGLPTAEALDALDAAGRLHWPKRKDGIPMLKRYIEEAPGIPALDVIADIKPLNNVSAERLGYPTQKPQALLERIIKASSNTGDVVLDPFCGCGTTVAAAQALGRRWLGIDITYLAIDLIRRRLEDTYGSGADFIIEGIPRDVEGAQALFNHNPLDFERWAVSLVFGQPNQKQVGDRGLDGVIRFPLGSKNQVGRALVSVKGGRQLNPAFVRDLKGTVVSEKAELGILVTIGAPTRGMVEAANRSGSYTWPVNGTKYPTIQIVTIEQLLAGRRPSMPPALSPYTQASRHVDRGEQLGLVSEEAPFYGNGGA